MRVSRNIALYDNLKELPISTPPIYFIFISKTLLCNVMALPASLHGFETRALTTEEKKQEVLGRTNSLLSFDTTWTTQKTTRPTVILLLHVYSLPR
jgi:hypothetical protein